MSHRMTRGLVAGALIASQTLYPSVSQAGPILDWLFGRRCTTAMYCPTTTAYAPVVQSPCSPCAAAGATAYSPVVAAQPTVAAYAPTAAYQTVQAQVPVTYYRPTTAYSPTVPAMAGCTAVQVQTQRRPVWDILGLFTPRQPVSPHPINVQYPTTVGYPAVAAPATVLPAPANAMTVPSYAAPSYAAPANGSCAGCSGTTGFPTVPTAPVNPGQSVLGAPPAATYPAPSGSQGGAMTTPAAPTPADQPPSLNAPPQSGYQGSSYRPAPPAAIAPPPANPAGQPTQPQSPRDNHESQLIPYPGAGNAPVESSAPPLLNQRGRTASLRRSEPWTYASISWPEANEVRQTSAAEPALAEPVLAERAMAPLAPAPVSAPVFDDSGWRPAQSR